MEIIDLHCKMSVNIDERRGIIHGLGQMWLDLDMIRPKKKTERQRKSRSPKN